MGLEAQRSLILLAGPALAGLWLACSSTDFSKDPPAGGPEASTSDGPNSSSDSPTSGDGSLSQGFCSAQGDAGVLLCDDFDQPSYAAWTGILGNGTRDNTRSASPPSSWTTAVDPDGGVTQSELTFDVDPSKAHVAVDADLLCMNEGDGLFDAIRFVGHDSNGDENLITGLIKDDVDSKWKFQRTMSNQQAVYTQTNATFETFKHLRLEVDRTAPNGGETRLSINNGPPLTAPLAGYVPSRLVVHVGLPYARSATRSTRLWFDNVVVRAL